MWSTQAALPSSISAPSWATQAAMPVHPGPLPQTEHVTLSWPMCSLTGGPGKPGCPWNPCGEKQGEGCYVPTCVLLVCQGDHALGMRTEFWLTDVGTDKLELGRDSCQAQSNSPGLPSHQSSLEVLALLGDPVKADNSRAGPQFLCPLQAGADLVPLCPLCLPHLHSPLGLGVLAGLQIQELPRDTGAEAAVVTVPLARARVGLGVAPSSA